MTDTLDLGYLRHETDTGRIVARLDDVAEAAVDIVVSSSKIAPLFRDSDGEVDAELHLPEPLLASDGTWSYLPLRFTRTGFRQLVERLDIPVKYADLTRTEQPELLDTNIEARALHKDAPMLLRAIRSGDVWVVRAVLSNQYQAIDNMDMFIATVNGARNAGVDIGDCMVEADWTDDRFRLRIAVPSIEVAAGELLSGYKNPFDGPGLDWTQHTRTFQQQLRERGARVGDVLWAGLEASNSETGGGAATVGPRAVVLVCLNGLTRKADILRQVHLGGRLEQGVVAWSAETQRKAVELIEAKMADAVRMYCSAEYLEAMVAEMRQSKDIAVQNPVTAFEVVKTRLGFSEEERDRAMSMFLRSGEGSVFGVASAVTAMAQTVDDGDRQAEIEQAFWDIVGNPGAYQGRELIGA